MPSADSTSRTPQGRRRTTGVRRPSPALIGQTLAHYRILDKLGSGGMGEIYLALDTRLGRKVALKILPPEFAAHRERLERFQREIRILASLNHPSITTIYSVERAGGVRFFTMEVVEGRVLSEIIRPSGVPLARFFRLAIPLVDAVSAAHEQQITHRDLKPGNVMVSREGRVKVLDFGLAKTRKAVWSSRNSDDVTFLLREPGTERALTEEGRVLGTGPYMSPEQVRGQPADTRSDVFALGILLYEMITGQRPFQGESQVGLLSSILHDSPDFAAGKEPFPERLEEILNRCLEKDPRDRFQNAGELHRELRDLGKEPEIQEILRDPSRKIPRPVFEAFQKPAAALRARVLLSAAVVLVVLMVTTGLGVTWFRARFPGALPRSPSEDRAASEEPRPFVAVLYFDNLSGESGLEWMRMGLTDMLVTDLSRSAEIEVLSTNLLHKTLKDLGRLEARILDWEAVRDVARSAEADFVVVGNFAKVGATLQVSLQLQDAESGEILTADRREGPGEESVFSIVEELARGIRRHLEATSSGLAPAGQGIRDFTTSSVEALRLYSEAKRLHLESKDEESVYLFEKAVEVDPGFARALLVLGTVHGNLGHERKAREYTRRALGHAERLPEAERYVAEANFYGAEWATYDRALEAMERTAELFPDNAPVKSALALHLLFLERNEEAIEVYEDLIRRGNVYAGNYSSLAQAYSATGAFDRGYEVVAGFAEKRPGNWFAHLGLAWHLTHWERFDQALASYARAEELRPREFWIRNGLWRLYVLRGEWAEAERLAEEMKTFRDPYRRWRGLVCQARNRLYAGRSAEALELLEASTRVYPEPNPLEAMSHGWAALVLLARSQPAEALVEASEAQRKGKNQWPERYGAFLAALSSEELGNRREADRLAALLAELNVYPNTIESRRRHLLAGLSSLERGDAGEALLQLGEAEKLLPPRGIPTHWHVLPDHVPVWYALAEAHLAAGHDARAAEWFERVTTSGLEHIEFPIRYVRSFYLLAKIRESEGRHDEARELYRRFADFWRDGDLDRERLEEALRKIR